MNTARFVLFSALLLGCAAAHAAPPSGFDDALQLYKTKHYPDAQAAFEQLARAEPENAAVAYYLGRLAEKRGSTDDAVAYLEKAATLDPANAGYALELGGAYGAKASHSGPFSALGWARKCRAALEKAVALAPADVEARLGLANFYADAPGIAGGDMNLAFAQARAAQTLDPVRGGLLLAALHAKQGDHAAALADAQSVLRAQPANSTALFIVGRECDALGQISAAGIAALQKFLSLPRRPGNPPPAAALWHLGNLQLKQGDRAAARTAYEAALKSDSGFEPARDALAALP